MRMERWRGKERGCSNEDISFIIRAGTGCDLCVGILDLACSRSSGLGRLTLFCHLRVRRIFGIGGFTGSQDLLVSRIYGLAGFTA